MSRHGGYLGWHRTENNERPATPRSSPSCGTEKLPTRAVPTFAATASVQVRREAQRQPLQG